MMLMGATATFAEEGDKWAGINFSYGVNSKFKNFAAGAKFQYEVKQNLRLEAAANYFFKRSLGSDYNEDGDLSASQWDINLNAQYLIHVADKMNIYPIVGPSIMTYKTNGLTSYHTRFGVNIGAGWEYELNDEIKVNFDFKYQYLKDIDRPVFAIGAAYKL